jgi:hypothetical protein
MADAETLVCWDSEDIFAIGARLKTPGGYSLIDTEQLIELDSGYSGELLVPWKMYVDLELYGWEYPEEEWSLGISVSGEHFEMPLSKAVLSIPRLGQDLEVSTDTFEGNEQFLIGRAFMRRYKILLDGPENRVCFIQKADR